jgi:NifU-like protein involved in Fe-S cluster formation
MRNVLPSAIGFRLVPGNFSPMKGADLHGQAQEGGCGHAMEMWLKLEEGRVAAATFTTDGCESFVICGSLVAHLARGRTLEGAGALDVDDVLDALGDHEPASRHSAELALDALRDAVKA